MVVGSGRWCVDCGCAPAPSAAMARECAPSSPGAALSLRLYNAVLEGEAREVAAWLAEGLPYDPREVSGQLHDARVKLQRRAARFCLRGLRNPRLRVRSHRVKDEAARDSALPRRGGDADRAGGVAAKLQRRQPGTWRREGKMKPASIPRHQQRRRHQAAMKTGLTASSANRGPHERWPAPLKVPRAERPPFPRPSLAPGLPRPRWRRPPQRLLPPGREGRARVDEA